ncbi:MAG: hypothetical protein IJ105_00120 [Bacilli bacterium]|nr:hypothetical protein [Bacilli bacterium]
MSDGGKNREWGYASYDVDRYDDYSDSNIGYTSYEKNGSVNKYNDNGDGGHSHDHYKDSSNYNSGGDADYSRSESNSSSNPSTGEVQSNGGCYLTSACMKHMQEEFDDNCEELTILRWFRDKFVSEEDIKHYYKTAPIIVDAIDKLDDNKKIYEYIYENIVNACVKAIKNKDYDFAYNRYKSSILALEEQYARKALEERLINALKLKPAKK